MEGLAQDEVTRNLTAKVKHSISEDWLISFKDPITLWEEHWFALTLEVANAIILYNIFRYAKRKGNESCYLVLASMFTAICFELLPLIPQAGYQLWWYHQGMVNIVNRRVPSYVIIAIVHYVVYNLTRDSNLPLLIRSLVSGLCGIAMYCPLLWLAPRLLLTIIHFDDVVFRDSIFGVPCVQIMFMFFMFLHTSQVFIPNYRALEDRDRSTYNLVWCSVQSGLVAAIYAVVEQYVLYILIT
ncbi:hypothetical protein JTE90_016625 [Oedothorax gibbosus]|uniref:DUF7802 domain-containing protein n=1 Tax=Oedothorax gibbosus TaxID=931172 RepID=A0AAV6UXT6_9ARAC|nr:hypothetical protein JTE90_016625 [Oedothorax gibbosus]